MSKLIEYNLVMSASTGGTPVYGKAGVDAELAALRKVIAEQRELMENFAPYSTMSTRDAEIEVEAYLARTTGAIR